MNERQAVVRATAARYRKSGKRGKSMILDEFLKLTGYNRKYGITLLSNWGIKKEMVIEGERVLVVAGQKGTARKSRPVTYGEDVRKVLTRIWWVFDCICGKRLKAVLRWMLPVLLKTPEFACADEVWKKLERISAATIDRVLKPEKAKGKVKGRSYTQPGRFLAHKIPILRSCDEKVPSPGYVQIDLVSHDGGIIGGDFSFTLNVTDVDSGWTEPVAVRNKAQKWVFEGLLGVRRRFPVAFLGIHSDNGGEFINDHLYRYCKSEEIKFTRSREYRKNDNCHVEQKNYSVVRRYVGYLRHDSDEEVGLLNQLYGEVRLLVNFFLPSMKLEEKIRVGSKVTRKYGEPKTPCLRLLESSLVDEEAKMSLRKEFENLNPVLIQRSIQQLQEKLYKLARLKSSVKKAV